MPSPELEESLTEDQALSLSVAREAADTQDSLTRAVSSAARLRQSAILRLHRSGLSLRQIASLVGTSHTVVADAVKAAQSQEARNG